METGTGQAAERISFTLNGRRVEVDKAVPAATTLLHWLRGPGGLTGTKEGCAEGDCGACTVVLEGPDGGRAPVNACLAMLGQMHGRALRTVEGLRGPGGAPHPVQEAMARADATQCGFCTPGFVMSAWAHAREGGEVHEALAGNLCRCTGYRPILDAFATLEDDGAPPPTAAQAGAGRFAAPDHVFHLPSSLDELLALRAARPGAVLLAGGTDLGLTVSEGHRRPAEIICLLNVPDLQVLESRPDGMLVGAAVPYERLLRRIEAEPDGGFAPLLPLLRRLGSRQIRALGTLGGNLGTASPIGDALPPLIALGATLRLRRQGGAREMAVQDFLRGYRLNALAADEVIESVWLPRPPAGSVFACEKLSKRHDQDIATLSAALLVVLEGSVVREARLAFGGMGPVAARAAGAEAVLLGAAWSEATVEHAAAALARDFTPLSDWRAGAEYRRIAAANLLRRLWWRTQRPDLPAEVQSLSALEPV